MSLKKIIQDARIEQGKYSSNSNQNIGENMVFFIVYNFKDYIESKQDIFYGENIFLSKSANSLKDVLDSVENKVIIFSPNESNPSRLEVSKYKFINNFLVENSYIELTKLDNDKWKVASVEFMDFNNDQIFPLAYIWKSF